MLRRVGGRPDQARRGAGDSSTAGLPGWRRPSLDNLGHAGSIYINNSEDINISGPETSNAPLTTDATGVILSTGVTNTGESEISISTKNLSLGNRSMIFSYNKEASRSGDITIISKENTSITNGSTIWTTAYSATNSDAGNIEVTANSLNLSGINNTPFDNPFGAGLRFATSSIISQLVGSHGKSGDIKICVGDISIADGANITTHALFSAMTRQ